MGKKIKKQGKKAVWRNPVNRAKRLKQKDKRQSKWGLKVESGPLRENWDNTKSVKGNLEKLGLSFNPNKVVKTESESMKHLKFLNKANRNEEKAVETTNIEQAESTTNAEVKSQTFTESYEKHAKSLKKVRSHRFSNEQVLFITHLLDKHKFDFKAMARDPRNHYQETPKQIEKKVRQFMKIPEHFAVYCRDRGMLDGIELEST